MRVKQPEIFDPKREYKPGERAIYKGKRKEKREYKI